MSRGHLSLRNRVAAMAHRAGALAASAPKRAPFSLAFLTDLSRISEPLIVARALPVGAAVILRDYTAPNRAELARRLAQICRARGLFLLIGADAALARRVGAHGVHWPSWSAPRRNPDSMIISAACHSRSEILVSARAGADLVFLSPVFPTTSHPGADNLGVERFRKIAAAAPMPVLALGGIESENINKLRGAHAAGIGAIGALSP